MKAILFFVTIFTAQASLADFVSVCERNPQIRATLVGFLKKDCSAITEADVLPVRTLDYDSSRNIYALYPEDLQGFVNLETIRIRDNYIGILPGDLFQNNPNLKVINFENNHIRRIPKGLFKDLTSLETVNFSRNNILDVVPENAFADNTSLKRVSFERTNLSDKTKERLSKELGDIVVF